MAAGQRVLLQPVRVLAPARALADQLDFRVALPRISALPRPSDTTRPPVATERRPVIAEDARVAVVVGADRAADPHVGEQPREDEHRVPDAGYSGYDSTRS